MHFSLRSFLLGAAIGCAGVVWSLPTRACQPTDFIALELPVETKTPVRAALELAYPDLRVTGEPAEIHLPDGSRLPLASMRNLTPQAMLESPTILEQFVYTYPLAFDLSPRLQPFNDPGRLRNSTFFEQLYFDNSDEAKASLRKVPFGSLGAGAFLVTSKHGVHCQLEAVLMLLASMEEDFTAFFESPGGSFNWRRIAGTSRLSAHSLGVAVDLNSRLGGYWRWSGAREGDAGAFDNRMPAGLVAAFERYGFIWGGKWHHYDGMHFEYRPELILHARLLEEGN